MSNREELRKRMHLNPRNLSEYVIQNVLEYKEELSNLEHDNKQLDRENAFLLMKNKGLEEQISLLYEEISQKDERINNLISRFGCKKLCYNCSHFLECYIINLCVYCQKKICYCCFEYCETENCIFTICNSCSVTHPKCPLHFPNFPKDKIQPLLDYFDKNHSFHNE